MKVPPRGTTKGALALGSLKWFFLGLTIPLILSLSSCWHPPFNADLSASEFTVSKLGSPVWAVTVHLYSEASGGYYLPYRDPSQYYSGAWVWKSPTQIRFGYLQITGPNMYTFNSPSLGFPNEMGNAVQIRTPMGTNTSNYVFFGSSGGAGIGQYVLSSSVIAPYWSPSTLPAVGMGMVPDTATTTDDLFYMAYFNIGQLNFVSSQITNISTLPPAFSSGFFVYSVPVPAAPGFFAQSPANGGFYLSAKEANGAFATYFWSNTGAEPIRLPVNVQITGMLSDGRLLADSSSSVTVYSPMGEYLFTINTGALHFVHERYDSVNLCWISVFTRTVEIPQQNTDNNQYRIEIYEIKTRDLQNLAR